MPNAFALNRAHGPHPARFLHLATGDGILAVDVQAALERIAMSEGADAQAAERRGARADMETVKKPKAARALYEQLRRAPDWDRCPHGYATVMSLSAQGPQRVGPFLIRAPWHPTEDGTLEIVIEPGLAFGLGTHATTRLPLRQIADLLRPGIHAGDVGCGSGVLSIAMALLGAAHVHAVDRDPVAVAEARDNIARNDLPAPVHVAEGSASELDGPLDLITANMGGAPSVVEIAPDVAARLKPGGFFLASGIYGDTDEAATATADGVSTALRPLALIEERRDMDHQCVGIVYRKQT